MTRTNERTVIEIVNLDCKRGQQTLLHNVNMKLAPGTVSGLIGPNGAGKSSLIATLLGDIRCGAGAVTYCGIPVRELKHRSDVFGVVTEAHGLPGRMTAGSAIRYWAALHSVPQERSSDLCRLLGVQDFQNRQVRKLSTGMRRRVELVLALLPEPQILILDEPFNGLDIDGVEAVRNLVRTLRAEGKIILLTTHTLSEIDQLADDLYAVHGRKLIKLQFAQGESGASEAAYQRLREGE